MDNGLKKQVIGMVLLTLAFGGLGCGSKGMMNSGEPLATNTGASSYKVINSWPHDRDAYTQGLIFHEGKLIESTGQHGRSSLRRVELETGNVLQKVDVPSQYFAEGLTLFRDKLYQLTWQGGIGFMYDPSTFEKLGEFNYYGEGWGLTHDNEYLILSDGSSRLRFLDPQNFQVKKTLTVSDQGMLLRELNELEYVNGEILANVWHTDHIARIDPQNGRVIGWIDLSGMQPKSEIRNPEAVLNGIAYDEASGRLFVTGKLWPSLFEIRVKER